jgi:DDE superfamily endonuclease
VRALQQAHPDASVELWAEDEHRVGLKPILRRVWARRGQRPRAVVHPRYEWEYVYGFVQPEAGATHWLLMPMVNIAAFTSALAHFAEQVGAGADQQILLVVDQAGWHDSPQVRVPTGVHLESLPAYSPELQPAERLWPLTNEPLANRAFPDLAALDAVLAEQCVRLTEQPDRGRAQTLFHWWPRTVPMPEAFNRS